MTDDAKPAAALTLNERLRAYYTAATYDKLEANGIDLALLDRASHLLIEAHIARQITAPVRDILGSTGVLREMAKSHDLIDLSAIQPAGRS